jgi:hypothetical protein
MIVGQQPEQLEQLESKQVHRQPWPRPQVRLLEQQVLLSVQLGRP